MGSSLLPEYQVASSSMASKGSVALTGNSTVLLKSFQAFVLALTFVGTSWASDCAISDEMQMHVDAMLGAASRIDYRGTLLVEYGKDREFIAVNSAQSRGKASLLRLNKTSTQGLETVQLLPSSTQSACALSKYYAFALEPEQPVAGRNTVRLTVRPRDTLRLGYVMDLDKATGVPLRVVTAMPDGQVLERFEFAQFEVTGPADQVTQTVSAVHAQRFTFATLPPGFRVVAESSEPTVHQVLSDGLASVSVFIEHQPRALAAGEGVALRGSTLAYTRGTPDHHLITVMGEVPITTARLLADAVRTPQGQ